MSAEITSKLELPGRLGDKNMTLASDPRTDPRCFVAMSNIGMLESGGQPCPVSKYKSPYSNEADQGDDKPLSLLEWAREAEIGICKAMNEGLLKDLDPIDEGIVHWEVSIKGEVDGNEIRLYIAKPEGEGPFPCIFYCHGGGLSFLSANEPFYARLRYATTSSE